VGANGKPYAFGRAWANDAALIEGVNAIIARRERIAGRTLTRQELASGVSHIEDRDVRQRKIEDEWTPTRDAAPPGNPNPFESDLAYSLSAPELSDTEQVKDVREKLRAKSSKEWEAQRQSAEAKAAFESNPKRIEAIARATELHERLLFDPTATQSEVARAERLVRQAREGLLSVAATLYREAIGKIDAKRNDAIAALNQEMAAIEARKESLSSDVSWGDESAPSLVECAEDHPSARMLARQDGSTFFVTEESYQTVNGASNE
jgi:hypothetical protein